MTAGSGRYVVARAFRAYVVRRGFRADGREWAPGECCPEASSWATVRALVSARYLVPGPEFREGEPIDDAQAAEWVNVERLVEAGFLRIAGDAPPPSPGTSEGAGDLSPASATEGGAEAEVEAQDGPPPPPSRGRGSGRPRSEKPRSERPRREAGSGGRGRRKAERVPEVPEAEG